MECILDNEIKATIKQILALKTIQGEHLIKLEINHIVTNVLFILKHKDHFNNWGVKYIANIIQII